MTATEKLNMVKAILRITDTSEDTLINTYLEAAASEILGWRYSYSDYIPQSVPKEYSLSQPPLPEKAVSVSTPKVPLYWMPAIPIASRKRTSRPSSNS